ncbi:shikimate dehydrogenase [Corynebacterium vitaeruminis]|uniref:shikimate dehydrogenase n=1 Tax=Corynebacterium vitaeruminis TaxID=38305 RepID=UPI0035E4035E
MSVNAIKRAAVLGQPIEHSLSPVIHNAGYAAAGLDDWEYGRFECAAGDLAGIVGGADESYRGFSVTMPAKFAALEFADELTERARLIGSANTLVRTDSGWRADNTDCLGVLGALAELGITSLSKTDAAVVVGGGGTARPALWALTELGVGQILLINRTDKSDELRPLAERGGAEFSYSGFEEGIGDLCAGAAVVISTVPSAAIAGWEEQLAGGPVLDVIYDPWPTPLVTAARAKGYSAVGGHSMLLHQGLSQFEQYTGHPAPEAAMRAALMASLDGVDES